MKIFKNLIVALFLLLSINNAAVAQFNGCPAGFCPNAFGGGSGSSLPSWVINPSNIADLSIDWANNRAYNKSGGVTTTATSLVTVSRATPPLAYVNDSAGNWTGVAPNVLRWTDLGALIEESRTNSVRNNSAQGAVVGTVRTPVAITGLSRTGSTTAVALTTGTVAIGDIVTISGAGGGGCGANCAEYNGSFAISAISAGVSFSFITVASRTDSATGASYAAVSTGTFPTNSSITFIGSGLTSSISAIGVQNGIDYFDVRIAGVTGFTFTNVNFEAGAIISSALGQLRAVSIFTALAGGSLTNVSGITIGSSDFSSLGSFYLGEGTARLSVNTTSSLLRTSALGTISHISSASIVPYMQITYPSSGIVVDLTIRIGWVSEEQVPSTTIASTVASATAGGVTGAVMATGGATCTNGVQQFTGTLGTGTKAVYLGTVVGNALQAGSLTVVTTGAYTVAPGIDTLTGGGCGTPPTVTTTSGAGTGYGATATGTLTWSGAGCSTNPIINVTTDASGGVVTVNSITNAGSCSTFPSPLATTWTAGGGLSAGSGVALNVVPTNQAALGFTTSPIRTTTVAVNRAADVVSLAGNPITLVSAWTLYSEFTPQSPDALALTQGIIEVSDNSINNRSFMYRFQNQGSSQSNLTGVLENINRAPSAVNVSSKLAFRRAVSDQAASLNGGAVGTASNASLPTGMNVTRFGSFVTGSLFLNGFLKYSAMWASQGIPNAQLISISTP